MAWIRACGGGSPAVPDGKTVTPINDVTIWQQCAGIANPTYTTLAEILADTGILQTLMASNNAVDYLARCKAWIGKALIPTMTSNTHPSGIASMDRFHSATYDAYKAFDADSSTYAISGADTSASEYYLQYEFPVNVEAKYVTIGIIRNSNYHSSYPLTLSVRKNGTWTDVSSFSISTPSSAVATSTQSISDSIDAIKIKGKRQIISGTSTYNCCAFVEVQVYAENICDNANAMNYIGQNNYASNTLLADSDWCSAICNSAYFESVLNVKVPVMTSNTTPSGEASSSTVYDSSYQAYKAFDENTSDGWRPSSSDSFSNAYIRYDFGKTVDVFKIQYTTDFTSMELWKSDGTWEKVTSISHSAGSGETILTEKATGRYFQIKPQAGTYVIQNCMMKRLQFYGREDV